VPPLPPLTSCIPTKYNLYFDISSAIVLNEPPCRRSYVQFLLLMSFIQRIRSGPRSFMTFRNKLIFYGEELLAPRTTPKLPILIMPPFLPHNFTECCLTRDAPFGPSYITSSLPFPLPTLISSCIQGSGNGGRLEASAKLIYS
jgi:hypothetical protein